MKPEGPVARRGDYTFERVAHAVGAEFIKRHHYARGCSKTGVFFGAFKGGALVGVCQFLPPTKVAAQSVDKERWRQVLSLTRMAVLDSEPQNATSMLLGASIRMVRGLRLPDGSSWEWLVTYADEARGHTGAIYRATNWTHVGRTGPYPRWVDAEGRQVATKSGPKTRTAEQMRALGYINEGVFFKEKFTLRLTPRQSGIKYTTPQSRGPKRKTTMASAWDIIGKASATQRGTPFSPGTQGEATVAALREFVSNNDKGLILVLEADIVTSVAKGDEYLVDIVSNKTAKTIVQKPGTRVSSVFMLNEHKAAPGAAKAMLLALIGENEATLTPESWSEIVQHAKLDDGKALKGIKFGFDTYAHKTKEGKTISLVRYSHIEQTDEEITKAANAS